MLYKKNSKPFSEELFKNPTSEYRATPFWAWNCDLNSDLLNKEIDYMKEMGFGGFHMHVRVGMSTKYLSDEFMRLIKNCVEKAKKEEMLAWLYDEDKWPSGFAGGYVTKNKENRQKYIILTKDKTGNTDSGITDSILAKYDVEIDENGCISSYKKIDIDEDAKNPWYAVLKLNGDSPWHNMQAYVDTLSPEAINEFINITHEKFKEYVGEDFGETVPAIFTDEPQVCRKRMFGKADSTLNAIIPYTRDFNKTYKEQYGKDFFDTLPEIFWELPDGKISKARYLYHDHIAERFAKAFADNIGGWCEKNGIALTGHMMEEPTLESQNAAVGDCMRSYRGFGLPGIDMLCDRREFTTAKQAQSATHQYGKEGVLSELYGVTGWNFKFSGHKMQGDWQAALGVSVRVPHLYWVSMHGEAKRDYPASIGHQSPWYKEYKYMENHFARVNTAMTRGKPVVKVGVIHPIESYWLKFGPREQTAAERNEMDRHFEEFINWMLFGLVDFDYICEANLPEQKNGVCVGKMKYDTVIVPYCLTMRSSTLEFLKEFKNNGGKVIFAGDTPKYVNAEPDSAADDFAKECENVKWAQTDILNALSNEREIDLRKNNGERADNIIYQLREDNDSRWLFFTNVYNSDSHYRCENCSYTLTLKGEYSPVLYNTFNGTHKKLYAEYKNGKTYIDLELYCHDSVLLRLYEGKTDAEKENFIKPVITGVTSQKAEITLSEPNVCVLDEPKYRLNHGEWREKDEILKICDKLKKELNYDAAISHGAQPWVFTDVAKENDTLELKYTVKSDVEVDCVSLALEDIEKCSVKFNGKDVNMASIGKYVDDSIDVIKLGKLEKGTNEILLTRSFGEISTVEACFLLGDFGVKLYGEEFTVTEPVKELYFGDWTSQGLPFYGGNVTYKIKQYLEKGSGICIPHFEQPVCTVDVDGVRKGTIAISPYTVYFNDIEDGEHNVEITAYGNRFNTFGALHSYDFADNWHGPGAWRKDGFCYALQYNIKKCGIITAPYIVKK